MTNKDRYVKASGSPTNLVGLYSSILITVITIVTFALAMTAIPISGANCPEGCIEYPYLDTVSQYPGDYLWMFFAAILILVYLVLMACIHSYASEQKRIFSQIGLAFASVTAVILLIDYFIQFSVVPISLINGETEGIALLTQYNPHGIFLVLEELGYLLMSLSFLFMAPVFDGKNRLEQAVRWVFMASFVLVIVSLVVISINYGLDRMDRFEVLAISIDWFVLIINGVLLSMVFGRHLRAQAKAY
jgi:hypothetical protein